MDPSKLRRRLTLAVIVAITCGALASLTQFQIDSSVSGMLPEDSRIRDLLGESDIARDASRSLYVVIQSADPEQATIEAAAAIREVPGVVRVESSTRDFATPLTHEQEGAPVWSLDDAGLVALEKRLSPAGQQEALEDLKAQLSTDPLAARETALRDPLGIRWELARSLSRRLPPGIDMDAEAIVSRTGDSGLLRVIGAEDPFNIDFSTELMAHLREALADQPHRILGGYSIATEDARRVKADLSKSLYFSIPAILLFLAFSTRSLRLPHLLLLPSALAVLWALGFGGLLLGPLSPLAVSAAAILIGLGIDYSIHFSGRYAEAASTSGHARSLTITRTSLRVPILGAMLTSAAAFLSVSFGSIPGLRSLGLLLAGGLAFALILTWYLLPIGLRALPAGKRPPPTARIPILASKLARSTPGKLMGCGILACGIAGWALGGTHGLRFEADPSLLRPESNEQKEALGALEATLGVSPFPMVVLFPGAEDPGSLIPGIERLASDGVIGFAAGPHYVVPGESRVHRIREFREAVAGWAETALHTMRGMGFRADRFEPAIRDWETALSRDPTLEVTRDAGIIHWAGSDWWRVDLFPRHTPDSATSREVLEAELREHLPSDVTIISPHFVGDLVAPAIRAELASALLVCLVAVTAIVLLAVQSIRMGIIALLPALCGLGACVAILVATGVPIHPGNLLALPLVLGLGVDDGIHMVMRAREDAGDPIQTTGAHIWRTTVTTSLGFGSLATATSPGIASLGILVLVGCMMCFLASVLIVPTAVEWLSRSPLPRHS